MNDGILWLVCCFPRSSFANQGEICLCTSRVYVQKGIYDQFLEKFVEQTRYSVLGLRWLLSVLHCTCAHFLHAHGVLAIVHNIIRVFPQAKLDSELKFWFCLKQAWWNSLITFNLFSVKIILFKLKQSHNVINFFTLIL